ncbi:MAG TPA: hypothetical protein VL426_00100 [Candidatus Binatia bacterium]|jgi:hypothetical protein|nr:hypothetical protein [Candidatus Binatia bacterium]
MISESTQKVVEEYFRGGNAQGVTTPVTLRALLDTIKDFVEGPEKKA